MLYSQGLTCCFKRITYKIVGRYQLEWVGELPVQIVGTNVLWLAELICRERKIRTNL